MDDDLLLSQTLMNRFGIEAQLNAPEKSTAAVFLRGSNGMMKVIGSYKPDLAEKMVAEFMVTALNKRIPQGGRWVTAWLGTGAMFLMIWLDQDGDPQFTVEIEEDAPGIVAVHFDHWINQAYEAWENWHHMMRDVLDPQDGETYKKAQGERPQSGRRAIFDVGVDTLL